jgi:hypothetical protein
MSERVQIKIHDVIHDDVEYDVGRAEEYIESWIGGVGDVDVRVASGAMNSPIFVTVDSRSLSMDEAKSIAQDAVRAFSELVDGVNVEKTIREQNIRIRTET